jgi:ferric-dicitrate binding protein FerR (iron transport regulator)
MNRDQVDLERAIVAVRGDEVPASVAEAAGVRVWERLAREAGLPAGAVEAIRGCADVQALLPAHREGALPAVRALLVEDHLRECAVCRASWRHPGATRLAVLPWRRPAPAAATPSRRLRHYAVAASALLAAGVASVAVRQAFFAPPPGSRASVQSVSGTLHRVAGQQTVALAAGQEVSEGETVRTARGSQALLRLRDGSIVEVGERSELSVTARGNDTTLHLERGRIIVQAAKRRAGHLRVAARDTTVEVTGTVFSVNSGLKGSRVSVIEGQVRVVRGGDEEVLAPGQQWATSAAMGRVSVRDEIAWSRDVDRHLALLGAFKALREKWEEMPTPGVRSESRLLPRVPADAVVFASVPNYGESLAAAERLFEEGLRDNPVLREWWRQADPARDGGPSLAVLLEKVRNFAVFLGDEIALVVLDDGRNLERPLPVVLAEVRRPGLREFLDRELPSGRGVPVLLRDDLIAVSPEREALRRLEARLGEGGAGLAGTPFGARILDAYRGGVGLLFAADLQRITAATARSGRPQEREALARTGLDGVRHLIVERAGLSGDARARLAFDGDRRGVASWLAPPAPMGSLDFFSTSAEAVGAFVFKSPALVLDDVLRIAGNEEGGSGGTGASPQLNSERGFTPRERNDKLAELESKLDLRLREDLAETLGGEFAVALDGPLLPIPAWKLVIEVEDPARLQTSLQVLVNRANDEALRAQRPGVRLEAEQAGERTYYSVRGGGLPFEVHYAFADGYLVAAASRAFVMRAIQVRESGDTLARSDRFQALFPSDRHVNVSGLVYQDLGPLVRALLDTRRSVPLAPGQRGALESLTRDAKPTLLCAYGEEDAIQLAGAGGLFDLDPAQLVLPLLLERHISGTRGTAAP